MFTKEDFVGDGSKPSLLMYDCKKGWLCFASEWAQKVGIPAYTISSSQDTPENRAALKADHGEGIQFLNDFFKKEG